MKTIGLTNRLQLLEAKRAARKGLRRLYPGEAERAALLREKILSMRPDHPWTTEDEAKYQEKLSKLPPLPPPTDTDIRLAAALRLPTTDELMAALRTRMSGIVPGRRQHVIPEPPLTNPPRWKEHAQGESQAAAPTPTVEAHETSRTDVHFEPANDDRLGDFRDDPARLPHWLND